MDRQQVLDAAIGLIDEGGLRELSMRRLGRRLGVEAMAPYRYWDSRDALLDGVVEAVLEGLYADPAVALGPEDDWADYLARVAHGVRRIALAHPKLFPLIATHPPAAPWLRPPLRSLRWVETFLHTLLSRGFTDQAALYAYRAFSSFLVGHLLLEVAAMGVDTGPVEQPDAERTAAVGVDGSYPQLLRLAPGLAEDHAAEEFQDSLDNLLTRLDAQRTQATSPGAGGRIRLVAPDSKAAD